MLKPIPNSQITRQVQEQVMALLSSGEFAEGDRLPSLRELTEELRVSRTAVREGLRALEALGMIEIKHGSGVYVAQGIPPLIRESDGIDDTERGARVAKELLEVRLILEPEVCALAALRATDQDLEKLRQLVEDFRKRVGVDEHPAADMQFHLTLCEAAHNASFKAIMKWIARFYATSRKLPEMQDVIDHQCIFEAVNRRNSDDARSAMREHLLWLRECLEGRRRRPPRMGRTRPRTVRDLQ